MCIRDRVSFVFFFELKEEYKGNYSYNVKWSSWTGFGNTTTIVVRGNQIIERRFESYGAPHPEANATYGHISDWNTSAVTDMSNAFDGRTTFNEDIGRWDVSNVTRMSFMFRRQAIDLGMMLFHNLWLLTN